MGDFAQAVKQAAKEAVDASKPVTVSFGTVTAVSPLTVKVSDKLTLTGSVLAVTAALTDDAGDIALALGDKLVLLRVQGGQKYIAVDRVVEI